MMLLGACSTPTNPPDSAGNTQPTASTTVLSVIGTPFLILAKIPICAATLAVVAPATGMSEVVTDGAQARRVLADGLSSNCGPPYVVAP
jgi:hypothetical protein